MLFDTQGDTYLVNAFHHLFASANLKSHSQHSTSFQSLHKTWVKTTLLLYRSCHWKSNTGRLHRICNYWIFLLMMPFTFLFNTFDVNGGALLFLAKCVTRNWRDWQDTQAISANFTFHFLCHFGAKNMSPKIAQVNGTHRLCQTKDIIWLFCCFL